MKRIFRLTDRKVMIRQKIGGHNMSKTKSSVRGKQNKKIVPVKSYVKKDGTKVDAHRRSTPN